MSYTAVLDANVLYPSVLRSVLIGISQTGLFWGRWTKDINEEWIQNLLLKDATVDPDRIRRTASRMNGAIRDCMIEGYETLIECLDLPDMNDRHVLAAAIVGKADAIVTFNLKDFPTEKLETYQVEAIHPDDFLMAQIDLDQMIVLAAIGEQRKTLKKLNATAEEFVDILERNELPQFAARIRPMTMFF